MRRLSCLLFLILLSSAAQAQSEALSTFNIHQENILRTGILLLGGWAILNILVGSFRLTNSTRASKHFYQMNLYWNVVNLLIAAIALHNILSDDALIRALPESLRLHSWYKTIIYLNVGLDLGYMMLGVYLKERSKNSVRNEKLLGWGKAVVLQGFFLFMLDLVLAVLLEYNAPQLFRLVPGL
ncbi:DUF6992 family protein [Pontibacter sp. MBLB2868]|uniref:DUF6992 family protein n=1 Tax=Pontibacter sp. MBLB2868 TaxID=3451555 RepID=UPI003F751401